MKLLHYTSKPLSKLNDMKYLNRFGCKPNGFWLSIDDEWLQFCEANGFSTFASGESCYVYEFEIKDWSNIYIVDSIDNPLLYKNHVDWKDLSSRYDGIAFLEYTKVKQGLTEEGRCCECLWFYGIDVSSICVWNTDILIQKSLKI
jgi:hypothetical protein